MESCLDHSKGMFGLTMPNQFCQNGYEEKGIDKHEVRAFTVICYLVCRQIDNVHFHLSFFV